MSGILLLAFFLWGCQQERWNVPTTLGGSPARTHNYASTAPEPPRLLFLIPLSHSDSSGCLQPPLPLSSRLTIVATTQGSLVAISGAEVAWSFRFPQGVTAGAALAADTATLYALGTDGTLYALSFEGRLRWQKPLLEAFSSGGGPYLQPLPFTDGVLIGDATGRLYRLSSSGALLWEQHRRTTLERYPVADSDGSIVVGAKGQGELDGDTVIFLESTGHQRWARPLIQTQLSCPMSVGKRFLAVGGLHLSPANDPVPVLHTFSKTGDLLWSRVLPAPPRWISLDDSNNVYVVVHSPGVGEPISGVLCFNAHGHQRWHMYLRASIAGPLLLFRTAALAFALEGNGALGAYIFSLHDGSLKEAISLEEAPPLLLQPAVTPDGSLLLGWSSRLGLLRFGEHPWRWLFF